MEDQIDDTVKGARFERLLALQNAINLDKNQRYEGRVETVLVEGFSKTDKSRLTGRSERNRLVHFEGDEALIGSLVKVKILRGDLHALYGELVKN